MRELNPVMHLWDVLVDPGKKNQSRYKLYFGEGELVAEVIDNTTSRGRTIRFLYDGTDRNSHKTIDQLGETPYQEPSYIQNQKTEKDSKLYMLNM